MTRRTTSARRISSATQNTPSGTSRVDVLEERVPAVAERPAAGAAIRTSRGRSGGIVDAPGKKHRRPMPTDPGANRADSQAAKMRAAKTMAKTSRHRGRG